jgi:hypothetical protein
MASVGLEAGYAGALAMVMAPGPAWEVLVQVLGRSGEGGFCCFRQGLAVLAVLQDMQFWRWMWPDWGRGQQGANGRVGPLPADARPGSLPMGA